MLLRLVGEITSTRRPDGCLGGAARRCPRCLTASRCALAVDHTVVRVRVAEVDGEDGLLAVLLYHQIDPGRHCVAGQLVYVKVYAAGRAGTRARCAFDAPFPFGGQLVALGIEARRQDAAKTVEDGRRPVGRGEGAAGVEGQ